MQNVFINPAENGVLKRFFIFVLSAKKNINHHFTFLYTPQENYHFINSIKQYGKIVAYKILLFNMKFYRPISIVFL